MSRLFSSNSTSSPCKVRPGKVDRVGNMTLPAALDGQVIGSYLPSHFKRVNRLAPGGEALVNTAQRGL